MPILLHEIFMNHYRLVIQLPFQPLHRWPPEQRQRLCQRSGSARTDPPQNKAVLPGHGRRPPAAIFRQFIPRPRYLRGPVRIVQTFLPLVEGGGWRPGRRRRPSLTSLHKKSPPTCEFSQQKGMMRSRALVAHLTRYSEESSS
ncbi:hypothetical protein GWK47_021930 [Chionoecetes opilio]|uniref:Uncharacterized protein n=1 Tax=Chionoecetes opilio TaxID=41210 RepID=A0A8J4XNF0_CHIOP|nr:hypothetical protein GWK47_021930 [Chionoecetes opilio]